MRETAKKGETSSSTSTKDEVRITILVKRLLKTCVLIKLYVGKR